MRRSSFRTVRYSALTLPLRVLHVDAEAESRHLARGVWSSFAEQRALEAADYIANDRALAAAAWREELVERVGKLDRFAQRGRPVREIGLQATHLTVRFAPRVVAGR